MIIVRGKSDNVVFYLFNDSQLPVIDQNGMFGDIRALDINPTDHEVVENVDSPTLFFLPGLLIFDGSWSVVDQSAYNDARRPQLLEDVVELMIEKQDGGMDFNGNRIATDGDAVAELANKKHTPAASHKIVPRKGKGVKFTLSSTVQFNAMHKAQKDFRKNVENHAFDLIGNLEIAADISTIDIHTGWPTS